MGTSSAVRASVCTLKCKDLSPIPYQEFNTDYTTSPLGLPVVPALVTFDPAAAAGSSQTETVNYLGANGDLIPVEVTVTRVGAGNSTIRLDTNGQFANSNGTGSFRLDFVVLPFDCNSVFEPEWSIGTTSVLSSERLTFDVNPVTSQDLATGVTALTLPYNGDFNDGNSTTVSALGFSASQTLSFAKLASNGAASQFYVAMVTGPKMDEFGLCDIPEFVKAVINEEDTFASVEEATVALTTSNGVDIAAGEPYILFPNGDTWDAPTVVIPDEIITESVTVKTSDIANASVAIQNMNLNAVATITEVLSQGDWTFGTNSFSYSGDADYVVINATSAQQIANGSNIQRPNPVLELQFSDDGTTWEFMHQSATGYIRDFDDHEESSNTIVWRDVNPPAGRSYRLNKRIDALTGVVTSISGQFDLEAFKEVVINSIVIATTPVTPNLPSAGASLNVNDFADLQFNGFRFSIQNATNADLNWEALLENKPYSTIDNLPTTVTLTSSTNADGTFNHLITGNAPLAAFGGFTINIAADSVSPPSTTIINPTLFAGT